MTDLEMTRLCAEAMGLQPEERRPHDDNFFGPAVIVTRGEWLYRPLHDDAQAMALAKKFKLYMAWNSHATEPRWDVFPTPDSAQLIARLTGQLIKQVGGSFSEDLNRAIVECVAKMQAARSSNRQGE